MKIRLTILSVLATLGTSILFATEDIGIKDNYLPLIDEENVWEYVEIRYGETDATYILSKFRFDGTVDAYGRTYYCWVCTSRDSWLINLETGSASDLKTEFPNEITALLREKYGCVYMLNEQPEISYTTMSYRQIFKRDAVEGEEVLLYSMFSDLYQTVDMMLDAPGYGCVIAPAYLYEIREVETEMTGLLSEYHMINVPQVVPVGNGIDAADGTGFIVPIDFHFAEGVGNTGYGTLTDIASFHDPDVKDAVRFNNLYDRKGRVIYPGLGIKAPETGGVGGVTDDTRNGEGIRYDLFGRRIREAAPGQIYIENGRKRVGR